jgi:hypothetical protein
MVRPQSPLAVQEYKRRGGGYEGRKRADNHLHQWSEEDWAANSGARSRDSGERYLPREARANLSSEDYRRTSDKKREDTRHGRQFSRQPADRKKGESPGAGSHRQGGAVTERGGGAPNARRPRGTRNTLHGAPLPSR